LALLTCVALGGAGYAVVRMSDESRPAGSVPVTERRQVDLDGGWRFRRADVPDGQRTDLDDSGWDAVSLPHTWNVPDGTDGGNNYYRGAGWYRRNYTPSSTFTGKRLWLEFDGADTVTDVWVDGTPLGRHTGGYARFRFDATAALTPAREHVIAVRVSNAPDPDVPPLSADYTFFGGLYRSVRLWVTDPLGVDLLDDAGPGMYLRQRAVTAESATVEVTARVANRGDRPRRVTVHTAVADAAGRTVAEVTTAPQPLPAGAAEPAAASITVPRPRLWQGKADPYLYRVTAQVRDADTGAVTDTTTQPLGLRTITVDPATGLFLNGRHLALHGVNRHQDVAGRGWALTSADQRTDFDIMDEMGVNALRTAHYQQDQQVYDLADERGYLVWTEIPLVNSIGGSPAFRANAQQQLRELIRQNYNHPSVAFWGIGNEQHADNAPTNTLLADLAKQVTDEDPDRLSTYAHNYGIGNAISMHTQVTGYNRYYGWYSDNYTDFAGWVDNLHRTYPQRRIAISEYGAGGGVSQHQENPPRPVPGSTWHPEEYQALFHEAYWTAIAARPYIWGSFVWNMFDFAVDSRREGDTPGRNDKGLVSYDRIIRKDAFYWYRANWTTTPFVHLTGARWTARTEPVTTVKVYGTADSVRLLVNGVQVGGPVTAANHIFTWPDVTLAPGPNTVEVVGTAAGATFTDTATWTLSPV
jgi:beta-galactosidase